MTRMKKFVFTGILATLLILALSCSAVPQGVQNLFATKTPTPTNTATSTPTPTVTPTPTKTQRAPVALFACTFLEECATAIPIEELSTAVDETQNLNVVTFDYDQPIQFITGWAAKDQSTLDNNVKKIKWIFTIDGHSYYREDWLTPGETTFENEPNTPRPGVWFGAVMYDWKIGEKHTVEIGYTIESSLNDGWQDYLRGTTYLARYLLIPEKLPTATATLTPTNTPVPTRTFTPKPLFTKTPVATPMPACSADGRIEIENSTGAYVTLNLSGPAKYRFDLPTGITVLNVCPGSYSYTAWGCGGAKDSGTINSGEAHEFYCQ